MSRKGIGGRRPTLILNPFVVTNEWEDEDNILWNMERVDIRIEDIIVGCVRSFNAHKTTRQEIVNWYKVYKIYHNCNVISRQTVQSYLKTSESQAKRYIQVIKLANPFLKRLVEGASGTDVIGYPYMRMYKQDKKPTNVTLNDLTNYAE